MDLAGYFSLRDWMWLYTPLIPKTGRQRVICSTQLVQGQLKLQKRPSKLGAGREMTDGSRK